MAPDYEDLLDRAAEMSTQRPIFLPCRAESISPGFARFLTFTAWVYILRGGGPMIIPTSVWRDRLSISKPTISGYIQRAEVLQLLEVTSTLWRKSAGGHYHRQRSYRFLIKHFYSDVAEIFEACKAEKHIRIDRLMALGVISPQ